MDFIPDDVWTILAVAVAGFILLLGLRILRRGGQIKFGKFEIDADDIIDVEKPREEDKQELA